jgi:dTDP-4-dehydrorhamnose reductase
MPPEHGVTASSSVLVLGGSSYLGRPLAAKLGPRRMLATYRRQPLEQGLYFDALTMRLADLPVDLADLSHAVILLGDAKPDSCAANPEQSWHLNVIRTKALLDELREAGVVPVFASTESVFDGEKGNYTERDAPGPIMEYGRQKLEIEHHLEDTTAHFLVVRLARLFSVQVDDATLLNAWVSDLEANRTVRCASDQVLSPLDVEDAAASIVALIDGRHEGIFNVAGPQAWSRLDILRELVTEYRRCARYSGEIVECSIREFPTIESRPRDSSLNPSKLISATGIIPKSVAACCRLANERRVALYDRRVAV